MLTEVDARGRAITRVVLGGVLPVALVVAWSWRYVPLNPLETDEGFYGIAARYASSGAVIYRDFAFNQTHVFPYLHGVLLRLIGFGLLQHRALAALYSVLAVAIVALGARRSWARGVAAACLALSPFFVARMALGQSFSMASMFLVGAGAVTVSRQEGRARTWAVAVLGALAIGSKLTVAPAVGVLWACEAWRRRDELPWIAPATAMGVLFLPVVLAAPSQWWFWNVGFHLGLRAIDFRSAEAYRDHLRMGPGVLALAVVAIVMALRARRSVERSGPLAGSVAARWVMAAALIAWAVQLPLRSTQGEYAILFLPLLALGAAEVIEGLGPSRRLRVLLPATALLGLLAGAPPTDRAMGRDLRAVRDLLVERVPGDAVIATPLPVVALESGHALLPGLEMGPFCVTAELPPERAAALHLRTPGSLTDSVHEVAAIVLTSQPSTWDFYWSVPSLAEVDEASREKLFAEIAGAGFREVLRNGEFTVLLREPGDAPAQPFWSPRH